jgi:hypothetical protein
VRSQQRKNGSYGLVVLIDFLTWGFLWFVSNLYFPKDGKDYKESLVTILLPTLAILREMANAIEPIHMGPATVDLLVGALFAGAWILLPDVDEQASHPQYTRLIKFSYLSAASMAFCSSSIIACRTSLGLARKSFEAIKFSPSGST